MIMDLPLKGPATCRAWLWILRRAKNKEKEKDRRISSRRASN